MPHFLLFAETTFSAAHCIAGVPMCDRVHGHNWRVQVAVRIEQDALNPTGMGIDFRDLERATQAAVADLEHRHLNDLPDFREHQPTAERIAAVLGTRMTEWLGHQATAAELAEVSVWEMPQYRVVYRP